MKGIDYTIRMILLSFKLSLDKRFPSYTKDGPRIPEREEEKRDFAKALLGLFGNLNQMMARTGPSWILTLQSDVIANFRSVFDNLKLVLPAEKIVPLACQYISHISTSTE